MRSKLLTWMAVGVVLAAAVVAWAPFGPEAWAPTPTPKPSDRATPTMTADAGTGADRLIVRDAAKRHGAHPSAEAHTLVLVDEDSNRLSNQLINLFSGEWAAQVRTDDNGEVRLPDETPEWVEPRLPVPKRLAAPTSVRNVPGRRTRLVARRAIDSVSGLVIDDSGSPIEGVAISGPEFTVSTGADGSFVMPRYVDSPHSPGRFHCFKEGYAPTDTPGLSWGTYDLVVQLARLASTRITVRRATNGSTVSDFLASVKPGQRAENRWSTPVSSRGSGQATLSNLHDGHYTIRVWAGSNADWGATSATLEVVEGMAPSEVEVTAIPSHELQVVVQDEQGTPLAGAHLAIEEWLGEDPPDAGTVASHSRANWRECNSGYSDREGRATLTFGASRSHLRVSLPGFEPHRSLIEHHAPYAISLERLCTGAVTGQEDLVDLLHEAGWRNVSLALMDPATHTITTTIWSESDPRTKGPKGTYALVATGTCLGPGFQRTSRVALGTIRIDGPGWTLDVRATRQHWPFARVRARFIHDGQPLANSTIRLHSEATPSPTGTSAGLRVATDERGFAFFVASAGVYRVATVAATPRTATFEFRPTSLREDWGDLHLH